MAVYTDVTAEELAGFLAGYELGDTTKPVYRSPRITYVVPSNDIKKWLGW